MFSSSLYGQKKNKKDILQQRKVMLQDEIDVANSILKETKLVQKTTVGQVQALNQKIKIRERIIRTIGREIKLIEKEIEESEWQIDTLEQELQVLKDEYAKMLITAYKNRKDNNVLMYILASENMEQAFRRIQYMQEYAEYRQKQGENIIAKQEEIKTAIALLNDQKEEKQKLLGQKNKEKKILQDEKRIQEQEVAKLLSQEQDITKKIATKQKEVDKLQAEIEKIIKAELARAKAKAERNALVKEAKKIGLKEGTDFNSKTSSAKLREKIAAKRKSLNIKETSTAEAGPTYSLTPEAKKLAAGFSSNKGNLPWPVEKGLLVGKYGKQPHPVAKGVIENRSHVEIASEKGSEARAVYSGTVSRVFGVKGSGLSIIISHGNYFTVYANLSSVHVKMGEEVDTKQALGEIYTNPRTQETVLNFGVWREMSHQNPEHWLFKK